MKSDTVYRPSRTAHCRGLVRITEDVADAVRDAAIRDGMVFAVPGE